MSVGAFTGYGYWINGNNLNKYLKNRSVFYIELWLSSKKSTFFLSYNGVSSKFSNEYINKYTWPKDIKISSRMPSLSYGYNILDNNNIKIIPFLSFGYNSIHTLKDDNYKKNVLESLVLSGGINFDYKFGRRTVTIYKAIRFGVEFFYEKYDSNLKGLSCAFKVGLLFNRPLTVDYD
jgi:hypothetical protein